MNEIEQEWKVIGTFVEMYGEDKGAFKEKLFKLAEIACYLHENNYSSYEIEKITYFVNKCKANFNISRNLTKKN
jgi:hypothetical protein